MAITQTGSVLRFAPALTNTGTVSAAITVPSDAELVIATWTGFTNVANYYSGGSMTFTKGGSQVAMTSPTNAGDFSGAISWMTALFYLVAPDTGVNKTLNWDWSGAGAQTNDGICTVTFWKGIDTASPVRDADGAMVGGGVPFTTPTLTAQTGDLIFAVVGAGTAGEGSVDTWSNLTLLSQVAFAVDGDCALATGSPTGNTTVAASTATNLADGSIVAVVLKPSAEAATLMGAMVM